MLKFLGLFAAIVTMGTQNERWVDPKSQEIPEEYRGTWALRQDICKDGNGPAFVRIGARHIYFYEKFGYLSLAQINRGSEPPSFFGRFQFVENLRFFDETVRLDIRDGRLVVSEGDDVATKTSRFSWAHCSADDGSQKVSD